MKTKLQARLVAFLIFIILIVLMSAYAVANDMELTESAGPLALFITFLIYRMFLTPKSNESDE